MYRYKISIHAEEDMARIYEYGLGWFGLVKADKYYEMLFECFSKIASDPLMFPEAFHYKEGYRYCVCGVDTIYFKINVDEVEIITIIGRQDF